MPKLAIDYYLVCKIPKGFSMPVPLMYRSSKSDLSFLLSIYNIIVFPDLFGIAIINRFLGRFNNFPNSKAKEEIPIMLKKFLLFMTSGMIMCFRRCFDKRIKLYLSSTLRARIRMHKMVCFRTFKIGNFQGKSAFRAFFRNRSKGRVPEWKTFVAFGYFGSIYRQRHCFSLFQMRGKQINER